MAPVQACSWQLLAKKKISWERAGGFCSTFTSVENISASGRQEEYRLGWGACGQERPGRPQGRAQHGPACSPNSIATTYGRMAPTRIRLRAGLRLPRCRARPRRGSSRCLLGQVPPLCAFGQQNLAARYPSGRFWSRPLSPAPWLLCVDFFMRCLRIIQLFSQA